MKHGILVAFGMAIAFPAWAHHGKDFLVVESYDIPHPGDVYAVGVSEWQREDGNEAAALEPSVLFGVMPRLAGEIHAHFVKEAYGESWHYEAIAPALHLQLTDHHADLPVQVGISAEYEIGHDESPDVAEGRLVLEHDFDHSKLTLNAVVEHSEGETEYGYAGGFRVGLSESVALGVEAQGSFESGGADEALAGVYLEPVESFTLKFGAGTRIGADGPDASARLAFVYRF